MAYFNFKVTLLENGLRVDKFITQKLPQLSRSYLQKSQIKVNTKIVAKNFRLKNNDQVWLALPPLKQLKIEPEKIPLKIIFEDPEVLVLHKPAGLICHPTDRGGQISGTLINALLYYFRQTQTAFGLVHRLDRETSGLLLVAKTKQAKKKLNQQFCQRTITKKYLALASGRFKVNQGLIDAPIIRHPLKRINQKISNLSSARQAQTEFQVKKRFTVATLLDINLLTGRTHQIRVHLKALKHPLIGDPTYGYPKINQKLQPPRLFLHAYFLEFDHPQTDQKMKFEIGLPTELAKFLKKLAPLPLST